MVVKVKVMTTMMVKVMTTMLVKNDYDGEGDEDYGNYGGHRRRDDDDY
jgi:hypothetical protein